jgi:hypothetical protein
VWGAQIKCGLDERENVPLWER